jgi:hypothetical protein
MAAHSAVVTAALQTPLIWTVTAWRIGAAIARGARAHADAASANVRSPIDAVDDASVPRIRSLTGTHPEDRRTTTD